ARPRALGGRARRDARRAGGARHAARRVRRLRTRIRRDGDRARRAGEARVILWQSFLDPDEHRPYVDALRAMLEAAAPGSEFDVAGTRPPDRHLHALTEVRCGIAALRNALWAERAGYDAIVIGHFQEPFLHEIRSSVSVPVVGLGEVSCAA